MGRVADKVVLVTGAGSGIGGRSGSGMGVGIGLGPVSSAIISSSLGCPKVSSHIQKEKTYCGRVTAARSAKIVPTSGQMVEGDTMPQNGAMARSA